MAIEIIRKKFTSYEIHIDGNFSFSVINKNTFWENVFIMYEKDGTEVASFIEKNYFIFSKRVLNNSLIKESHGVEFSNKSYFYFVNGNRYEIRYGVFDFKGFYFNNEQIATIYVKSLNVGEYKKEIFVTKTVDLFHLSILLYIAIDCFDVN